MAKYYYAPYNDTEMQKYAEALVDAKNGRMNTHRLVTTLENVGHFDRLYVILHGGDGILGWKEHRIDEVEAEFMGTKTLIKEKNHKVHEITPEVLCTDLIDAGLRNKRIDLRLFACNSGKSMETPVKKHEPVAQQLLAWLRQRGRNRISVSGYTELLDVTASQIRRNKQKRVIIDKEDNKSIYPRAKNYRRKF